jgi:lysophospholipid acyltransferase (LPLAT)-like uncharacterized protein
VAPSYAWLAELLGAALAIYLRIVARTCRVRGEVTRGQVILAHWHEFNMLAFVVARKLRGDLPHASFTTEGFRGIVITSMFRRSGTPATVLPLPPETNRAAAAALATRLSRLGTSGWSVIITPDGPFGPAHVAKPGALIVARESGLPLLPWAFQLRPAIRLTGRWDRQLLPLPFSSIRVQLAAPMSVAPREPLRPLLGRLQSELDALS